MIAVFVYYTPDMQVLVQVRTKPEDFYAVVSPTRDPFQEKCASSAVHRCLIWHSDLLQSTTIPILDPTNITPASLLPTFTAA